MSRKIPLSFTDNIKLLIMLIFDSSLEKLRYQYSDDLITINLNLTEVGKLGEECYNSQKPPEDVLGLSAK